MLQSRSTVFFALALAALLAGFATGRDLWFTLAYLLGVLLVVSFLWAWINLRWTRLTRVTRSRRTQVGQPLEERLTLVNTAWLPKLWLEVRDSSTFPGHQVSQVVGGVAPRRSVVWRVLTMSRVRGRYRLGPVLLRTSDPFGLFPMQRKLEQSNSVVVLPLTVPLPRFNLPQGLLSGGEALRRRSYQVTTSAAGVRDYAPGDSFNRIHWRSTARRGRLIVKEFELDPLADMWVIPDLSALHQVARPGAEWGAQTGEFDPFSGEEGGPVGLPASTEEYVVAIAASLARHFLEQDRAVGLMAYGQSAEIIQPDRGERQQNRILETLAVLRAVGLTQLPDTLLAESARFTRGTTLLIVTPSADVAWAATARELLRRGLRVVPVLVDGASFGGRGESADSLAAHLIAQGVIAWTVREGDALDEVFATTLPMR